MKIRIGIESAEDMHGWRVTTAAKETEEQNRNFPETLVDAARIGTVNRDQELRGKPVKRPDRAEM